MKAYAKAAFLAIAVVALVACGGDKKGSGDGGGKAPAPTASGGDGGGGAVGSQASGAAAHAGSLSGTVKLGAEAPAQVPLNVSSDAFCAGEWEGKTIFDPAFAVNEDGTVPNVFIYAQKGPHEGFTGYKAPAGFAVNQKACEYIPHVFGVMEGQEFVVTNDDGTTHNVNVKPKRNTPANKAQAAGAKDTFVFGKKEAKIPFTCDVHSWMSAWAFCLEHPFFATTDATGKFEIQGLPDGKYTFRAWHETFATKYVDFDVEIKGGAVTQEVTLPGN